MRNPPKQADAGTSPLSSIGRRIFGLSINTNDPKPKHVYAKIERDSFRAALMTSFEYVGNDLKKKQKQFFLIVTTVFLTVSFLTFLSLIGQLSPIQMLLQA